MWDIRSELPPPLLYQMYRHYFCRVMHTSWKHSFLLTLVNPWLLLQSHSEVNYCLPFETTIRWIALQFGKHIHDRKGIAALVISSSGVTDLSRAGPSHWTFCWQRVCQTWHVDGPDIFSSAATCPDWSRSVVISQNIRHSLPQSCVTPWPYQLALLLHFAHSPCLDVGRPDSYTDGWLN